MCMCMPGLCLAHFLLHPQSVISQPREVLFSASLLNLVSSLPCQLCCLICFKVTLLESFFFFFFNLILRFQTLGALWDNRTHILIHLDKVYLKAVHVHPAQGTDSPLWKGCAPSDSLTSFLNYSLEDKSKSRPSRNYSSLAQNYLGACQNAPSVTY